MEKFVTCRKSIVFAIPEEAGIRACTGVTIQCTFYEIIYAAHLQVRLTLQFLRALPRLWRESFLRSHPFADFVRDHQY
jgi:hypothetical protein